MFLRLHKAKQRIPALSGWIGLSHGQTINCQRSFNVRFISQSCGLVGLPNVGKSTLFNALARAQLAQAANYPFCTIEPNVAKVEIPDTRLQTLSRLSKSAKTTNGLIEFTDIAGLIAGASNGDGLGNKFLANVRDVGVIVHVVRCFEDPNVIHVEEGGVIHPVRDISTIDTELVLADLQSVENRLQKAANASQKRFSNAKHALQLQQQQEEEKLLKKLKPVLEAGQPARSMLADITEEQDRAAFNRLQLLTAKPVIYVCNVDEGSAKDGNELSKTVCEYLQEQSSETTSNVLCVSASMEEETIALESEEARLDYLGEFGLSETGLDAIIRASSKALGLQCFYTSGETESRAWTIPIGATARQAAGTIHSDMARGFIRAETIAYDDFIAHNGDVGARKAGKMRQEGRDYVVQDGDVMLFRFNVSK